MTRAIIDRVTCDKCGEIRHFSRFGAGTLQARLESMDEWLRTLGWCVQVEGLRRVDICKTCQLQFFGEK